MQDVSAISDVASRATPTARPQDAYRLSALEIVARVTGGELRAEAVLRGICDRIEQLDPKLNAFAHYSRERILACARAVDAALARGEDRPLAGVPFSVKDSLWIEGANATFGSRVYADFIAPRDSWAVARLRALGAVPLGLTNCSEFACKGVTDNLLHGATRNPWDLGKTPGGSSGGAAAAVAAGLGPVALATDAGGSTRRPAAHTGLVGMKPSANTIPHPWGFEDPNNLLSVIGLIGRSVADVALIYRALTASMPSPRCVSLPGLRIGYSYDLGLGLRLDADVKATFTAAFDALADAGVKLEPANICWSPRPASRLYYRLQKAGLARLHGVRWRLEPELFDPVIGDQIREGLSLTGMEVDETLRLRTSIQSALAALFEDFDVVLCPTAPVEAWSVDRLGPETIGGQPAGPRDHAEFTPLFNFAEVPAISIPCGYGRSGLPVGLQVVGPMWSDAAVLDVAEQLEAILGLSFASPMFAKR